MSYGLGDELYNLLHNKAEKPVSITERMENDGMTFQDAAAKESGVQGAAPDEGVKWISCSMCAEKDKRFAEHLEAWRVNSRTSAARIAELEVQLIRLMNVVHDANESTSVVVQQALVTLDKKL